MHDGIVDGLQSVSIAALATDWTSGEDSLVVVDVDVKKTLTVEIVRLRLRKCEAPGVFTTRHGDPDGTDTALLVTLLSDDTESHHPRP